jgi:hypothetical protein
MPHKKTIRCGRCKKEYDPQYKSGLIFREDHPRDQVSDQWDTSKKSWEHWRRCDKTFNLNGYHSWGKRGRYEPEDQGDYCYETTHVPDEEYDAVNDPILASLGDYDP